MRSRAQSSPHRPEARESGRFGLPGSGAQDGFTLIEVLASALIVALLAVGVLGGLDAATRSSYVNRLHTDAQALAQQDENRLRGLNINELSNLNKTVGPITLDGVQFTIAETATYVSDTTQTASCSSPSADYLKTTSSVTWTNMGAYPPVVATSTVTPPVVSASSGMGGIAVQVTGYGGASVSGMPVTVSGPTTATLNTDSSGCALFGNLTPGTYAVGLYSAAGTYVDETSGVALTSSTADTLSNNTVSAGSIQSLTYTVAPAGTLNYAFTSTSGNPVGVAPGAIGVVAYNATMKANNLRVCTLADGTNCPAVNGADTAFGTADWPQLASVTQTPAYPLFPFNGSDNYTVYAGTCSANDPGTYSGTDVTATLQPSASTNVTVTVPAMLIHVWTGTSATSPGSETFPAGDTLYMKDVGCGVRYYGYKLGTTAPTVAAGSNPEQADLPLNSNYPTSTTGGILAYPAMPYGKYNVCVYTGSKYWMASNVTNNNSSGTINIYTGSTATTGSPLGTTSTTC